MLVVRGTTRTVSARSWRLRTLRETITTGAFPSLRYPSRSGIRGVRTHPIQLDRSPPKSKESHSSPRPLVQSTRDHAHAEAFGESHPGWLKLTRLAASFASLPETRLTQVRAYSSFWPCAQACRTSE